MTGETSSEEYRQARRALDALNEMERGLQLDADMSGDADSTRAGRHLRRALKRAAEDLEQALDVAQSTPEGLRIPAKAGSTDFDALEALLKDL